MMYYGDSPSDKGHGKCKGPGEDVLDIQGGRQEVGVGRWRRDEARNEE